MKQIWKSRTLWVNVIGGLIVLFQYIGTINILDPEILATILVILNFILRFFTDKPLTYHRKVKEN